MISSTMDCFHGEVTLICARFHDKFMVITAAAEISQVLNFSCSAEDVTFQRSQLNLYGYHLRYLSEGKIKMARQWGNKVGRGRKKTRDEMV